MNNLRKTNLWKEFWQEMRDFRNWDEDQWFTAIGLVGFFFLLGLAVYAGYIEVNR